MLLASTQQEDNMTYSSAADEWHGNCGACGAMLYAPTKSEYILNYSIHTHSYKCLGGY